LNCIYLDYQATTPLDPRVFVAMEPWLRGPTGNASNTQHALGRSAADAVEVARRQVAALLNVSADDITFTSGATESIDLALRGAGPWLARRGKTHIVTTAVEHSAVLGALEAMKADGFTVSVVGVDSKGMVSVADIAAAMGPQTGLVSVMAVNNEIGTIQPVGAVGALSRSRGVIFHTDAAQAVGKLPFYPEEISADLVTFSSHKLYGPTGVGALWTRSGRSSVSLTPRIVGGGQERGLRAGTLNVAGIVGFGAACSILTQDRVLEARRAAQLTEALLRHLLHELPDLELNGPHHARLPGNLNVSVPGVDAAVLLQALPDLALSTGSACSVREGSGSRVVLALGFGPHRARSAVRFGLGRFTTEDDVVRAAARFGEEVRRHRAAPAPAPAGQSYTPK
jgi:cysteine desulfurase